MPNASVTVDVSTVGAFLHMRKGETLEEFKEPAQLRGKPLPVFGCVNCSTLYADADGNVVIHDDERDWLSACSCKSIELFDARTLKFDFEVPMCAVCSAVFEDTTKTKIAVEGLQLATPCKHESTNLVNARERGIAFWEKTVDGKAQLKDEAPSVPFHIVRAARLPFEKSAPEQTTAVKEGT
jgi:hypothetical protein